MYNTEVVKITTMKSGNIGIEAPFNASFKDELKALIPSAQWHSPYWVIKPSGEKQAEELLAKYYPLETELQKVRIEWNLERDVPAIDGVDLASVSRDWWGWKSDGPIDFKVIENEIDSGGSRKNPGLFGKLVIEGQIRPGANIWPRAKIEVIEDGQAPNPLADFSTEELLAELERRQ